MSRKVDLSKKLSESDVTYLISRDKWSELAYNIRKQGTEVSDEVRVALLARGFNAGGSKSTEESTDQEPARYSEESTDQEPARYSEEWFDETATVDELKEELRKRDLPVSGKRADLADRLYDHMVEKGEISED